MAVRKRRKKIIPSVGKSSKQLHLFSTVLMGRQIDIIILENYLAGLLKIEPMSDPAILFLFTYQHKCMHAFMKRYARLFIEALVVMGQNLKLPKCPLPAE